jgi:hypothetical protein
MLRFRALAAALTLSALGPGVAIASDGFSLGAPWKPGKVDLHLDRNDSDERLNLIWWSPVIKAGVGVFNAGEVETRYGGCYVRALLGPRGLELIAGTGVVDWEDGQDVELQAELRLPSGLGFGVGFVDQVRDDQDVAFAKAVHRGRIGSWRTVLAVQLQEIGRESSAGGYVGLWEDRFMIVVGDDGEHRRVTLAWIGPAHDRSSWRPALEGIWIDKGIGELAGPEILFVNGTLGFRKGFLSHPARLGRAMGPTGLEYANPLGFLWESGPWNRRLDIWELGGLGDVRLFRAKHPNGVTSAVWEALVFPVQLAGRKTLLDGLFVGTTYRTLTGRDDDPGVLAGYSGPVSFLRLALAVEAGLQSDDVRATFGLIDDF